MLVTSSTYLGGCGFLYSDNGSTIGGSTIQKLLCVLIGETISCAAIDDGVIKVGWEPWLWASVSACAVVGCTGFAVSLPRFLLATATSPSSIIVCRNGLVQIF